MKIAQFMLNLFHFVIEIPNENNMPIKWKKSICPYCGTGCGLMVGIENGIVTDIKGSPEYPVNKGDICMLAKNLPGVFSAKGRLTKPLIKRDSEFVDIEWDEAIEHIANEFKRIINRYGSEALAFYGGAANTVEEYYAINKLMKGFIGSNNIECSARLCMASSAMGFISTMGIDAPPACYDDIEKADLFFIAGNNMAVSLPIIFNRVSMAKSKMGTEIIVVDPRKTATASIADIHLQIKPGTDVALNNAIAHVLLRDGFVNESNVESYCSGLSALKEHIKEYASEKVSMITGCKEEDIVKAAHTIGNAKAMLTFWFQGYNHSTQAVYKNNTLHNISLLTNNFCRPGAGPLSINGEADTLGVRWTGALSHLLPGLRSVLNRVHCNEVADYWGVPPDNIKSVPGRSIIDIIKGVHSGDVRALWIMGTNPAVSLPNSKWVEDGLKKAELVITQDIFHPTETTLLSDVVLAGAQWCEKTGTFITSERRVELVEKMVEPPGEAKGDYEIICDIACAMGFGNNFNYSSPEEVFEEFKGITLGNVCDMGGVTYDRLTSGIGPQLPCPQKDHPGTQRLFNDFQFRRLDGRAALLPRDYKEPSDTISSEYPFILISGRLQSHFNTRTRTGRISSLNDKAPENFIEIHTDDAKQLNISENDEIEVRSKEGVVRGLAKLTSAILSGVIYMNMHYGKLLGIGNGKQVNFVTRQVYDILSKQPEFKFVPVNVYKLANH